MPRPDPLEPAHAKTKKPVPFPFLLDELEALSPRVQPMFGSHGVYVGEKIVFILRDKGVDDMDKGVWVVFEKDQETATRRALPLLAPIAALGHVKGWLKLDARAPGFEEAVIHACALVRAGDARVGKIPESKKPKAAKGASAKGAPVAKATPKSGAKRAR